VEIVSGRVYVNGQALVEPTFCSFPARICPDQIPEDKLFVLGDNRLNSNDSRAFGMVSRMRSWAGLVRYWPLDQLSLF